MGPGIGPLRAIEHRGGLEAVEAHEHEDEARVCKVELAGFRQAIQLRVEAHLLATPRTLRPLSVPQGWLAANPVSFPELRPDFGGTLQ